MKKIICSFLIIVLSLITLCACSNNDAKEALEYYTIKISSTNLSLIKYDNFQLTAEIFNQDDIKVEKQIKWISSDDSCVSVSDDGLLTAKKAGTATVTAKLEEGEEKSSVAVTISGAEFIAYLELDRSNIQIAENSSITLNPYILFAGNEHFDAVYTFSSDYSAVAEVSSDGVVKAISKGRAFITVTAKWKNIDGADAHDLEGVGLRSSIEILVI